MAPVTLAFIGDVMLGRLVDREIPLKPAEAFWGNVLPVLRSTDAVFANLECAISEHRRRWSRTPKVFHFGAGPDATAVLGAANVRYVSLANNHVLDFEEEGLFDTLRHLDAADIRHSGAGRNLAEAMAPAVVEVAGLRIGVIALTDNEPPFAADGNRPGTYFVSLRDVPDILEPVDSAAARLRGEGVDLVVMSAHLGPNMALTPGTRLREFAREVADCGVDIFHGHSAHVFQGVEVRNGRLIMHDTGDFLDDYAVDPDLRNDWSFIFLVECDRAGLVRLRLIPVRLRFARVDLAAGAEFQAIRDRMLTLCRDMGTAAEPVEEGLEIRLRDG